MDIAFFLIVMVAALSTMRGLPDALRRHASRTIVKGKIDTISPDGRIRGSFSYEGLARTVSLVAKKRFVLEDDLLLSVSQKNSDDIVLEEGSHLASVFESLGFFALASALGVSAFARLVGGSAAEFVANQATNIFGIWPIAFGLPIVIGSLIRIIWSFRHVYGIRRALADAKMGVIFMVFGLLAILAPWWAIWFPKT